MVSPSSMRSAAVGPRRAQGEAGEAIGAGCRRHRVHRDTDEDGATVFWHPCKLGLEGIVSKRLTAPYKSGPSRDWIKVKNPDSPAMLRHREGRRVAACPALTIEQCRALRRGDERHRSATPAVADMIRYGHRRVADQNLSTCLPRMARSGDSARLRRGRSRRVRSSRVTRAA
jgi:hypothetical protein